VSVVRPIGTIIVEAVVHESKRGAYLAFHLYDVWEEEQNRCPSRVGHGSPDESCHLARYIAIAVMSAHRLNNYVLASTFQWAKTIVPWSHGQSSLVPSVRPHEAPLHTRENEP
jgi:hypothetical protein